MRIVRVCVPAVALLLTGCSGSAETTVVQQTASRFVDALAHNDSSVACSLLAQQAVRRIDDLRPEGCEKTLPTLSIPVDRPKDVSTWGDTAQARSDRDTLFLRKFADGWRILGAGCTPQGEGPYRCKVDGT
ncbi:hypothetical protein [Kibdelosporangium aridum]|uniref:hypothetical protein n=1 Tax=Kibdelosporangium aridum TaxID=2030 RepID=UPI00068CE02B